MLNIRALAILLIFLGPAAQGGGGIEKSPIRWQGRATGTSETCTALKPNLAQNIRNFALGLKKLSKLPNRKGLKISTDLRPKNSAVIAPCCETIFSGLPTPKEDTVVLGSPAKDPYVTGKDKSLFALPFGIDRREIVAELEYQYRSPPLLGKNLPLSEEIIYKIPEKLPRETEANYENRRFAEIKSLKKFYSSLKVDSRTTYISEGSQSKAYWHHPPIPNSQDLARLYPYLTTFDERRKKWASENATEVIKLRNRNPWGEGLESAAEQMRRDLVLQDIFEQCANRFKVRDGKEFKPFIEVVKYNNSKDMKEISMGVLRQNAVHGISAYDLANLTDKANLGDKEAAKKVKSLGFSDVYAVAKAIHRLEIFYHETHNDLVNLMKTNDIPMMAGKTQMETEGSPILTSVGFDYNNGHNVLWDPKDKIFKAIDF
jgi:hypothetical protein